MKKKSKKRKKEDIYEEDFEGLKMKDLKIVKDLKLPSPEQIAKALKNIRITIVLDSETISFFRENAEKHDVGYQQMIRKVLREYMNRAKKAA